MWTFIIRLILRNRIAIIIIIGLVTAFMAWRAKDVRLAYEFAHVLPETDSTRINYNQFRKEFGEDGDMMFVAADDPCLFNLKNFNAWYDMNNDIDTIYGVDTVISIARIYNVIKIDTLSKQSAVGSRQSAVGSRQSAVGSRQSAVGSRLKLRPVITQKPETQEELDSLLTFIKTLKFYENFLFKENSSVTVIGITLNRKILNTKSRLVVVKEVKEIVDDFSKNTGIKVYYSGLPYIRTCVMHKIRAEVTLFIFLAAIVLAVFLYIFFRSFKAVIISLLVVAIVVVWVYGLMSLFNYEITILTCIIPPLMIIIGIPNCVYLLNKYHHEYKNTGNQIKSLAIVIRRIGAAVFISNLTTTIGFAAFLTSSSSILVEFGLIASLSVINVFLISLSLIPILSSFFSPPQIKHIKHLENKFFQQILSVFSQIVFNYKKFVFIAAGAIIILCLIGISKIQIKGRVVDDLPQDDPVYKDLSFFEKSYQGVMPFEIVIDSKKKNGIFTDEAKTLYKMKKLQKVFKRDSLLSRYFSRPLCINDAISFVYQTHKGGNPKFYQLPPPAELNQLKVYVENDKKNRMNFKLFIDSINQKTRFSVQIANLWTPDIKILRDSVAANTIRIFNPQDYNVLITGMTIVYLESMKFLLNNLYYSILFAIIIISCMLGLLFFSFRMTLIPIIPNLIPLFVAGGIMGFTGIPLKPSTILIFSVTYGIAVDYSIQFLTKYLYELKKNNWNIETAISIALKETGLSIIYAAIILFFGFGIFIASGFGGTKYMGILISMALLAGMFSNLLLLPSILLTFERKSILKMMKEPLLQAHGDDDDINKPEI
ncbi:MAG: MMPL family transporter [Bacteroidia bacterium]|nr:MMPL family transporter [Bacteroidia bacterium]